MGAYYPKGLQGCRKGGKRVHRGDIVLIKQGQGNGKGIIGTGHTRKTRADATTYPWSGGGQQTRLACASRTGGGSVHSGGQGRGYKTGKTNRSRKGERKANVRRKGRKKERISKYAAYIGNDPKAQGTNNVLGKDG